MSNTELIINRIKQLYGDATLLTKQMDEIKEWDTAQEVIKNINSIFKFAYNIVLTIEVAASNIPDITSEDKLNTAAILLDNSISLPWYLEVVDGLLFKALLSLAVSQINESLGKKWDIETIHLFLQSGKSFIEKIDVITSTIISK